MPWPVVCLIAVVIVFACCITLTSLLARTPLAVPLTGRAQQPWSTLIPERWRPRRGAAGRVSPAPAPDSPDFPDPQPAEQASATDREPATLVGSTSDQNGP
jgi:hypothetical protein